MFNLRPYQETAIEKIREEFKSGVKSTLAVMATGTGKTIVFCKTAKDSVAKTNKPVLILAHRNELLTQAQDKLEMFGLKTAIEKADSYALSKPHQVVVASVQSLSRPNRLKLYNPDHFGFIITDEAHHACAGTYRRIYKHFNNAFHLGVTATPNRHDEIGLKNVFQSVAYQYTIQDGIKDEFLCKVHGKQIEVNDLHLESIKLVAGDFSQAELDEMLKQESVLQGMVLPTIEYAEDRPTIVFTPGVEHAHEIAACFNRIKRDSAVAVDGAMDEKSRADALALYESGARQFLVNVGICTEGYDHPPTACIALFRPTKSLGLLAQMIGRGTRISEGKTDCIILDFVGVNNTVKTMNVYDVLDGTILNADEKNKAKEIADAEGCDAMEALEKAKSYVAQLDSIKAKMTALTTANAFDVLRMFGVPSAKGMYGGDLATAKQINLLEKFGVKCKPDLQKGEAIKLIDQLFKRIDKGLASFKQLKYLKRLGCQDNYIENLTFNEAGKLIGQLQNKQVQKKFA